MIIKGEPLYLFHPEGRNLSRFYPLTWKAEALYFLPQEEMKRRLTMTLLFRRSNLNHLIYRFIPHLDLTKTWQTYWPHSPW